MLKNFLRISTGIFFIDTLSLSVSSKFKEFIKEEFSQFLIKILEATLNRIKMSLLQTNQKNMLV